MSKKEKSKKKIFETVRKYRDHDYHDTFVPYLGFENGDSFHSIYVEWDHNKTKMIQKIRDNIDRVTSFNDKRKVIFDQSLFKQDSLMKMDEKSIGYLYKIVSNINSLSNDYEKVNFVANASATTVFLNDAIQKYNKAFDIYTKAIDEIGKKLPDFERLANFGKDQFRKSAIEAKLDSTAESDLALVRAFEYIGTTLKKVNNKWSYSQDNTNGAESKDASGETKHFSLDEKSVNEFCDAYLNKSIEDRNGVVITPDGLFKYYLQEMEIKSSILNKFDKASINEIRQIIASHYDVANNAWKDFLLSDHRTARLNATRLAMADVYKKNLQKMSTDRAFSDDLKKEIEENDLINGNLLSDLISSSADFDAEINAIIKNNELVDSESIVAKYRERIKDYDQLLRNPNASVEDKKRYRHDRQRISYARAEMLALYNWQTKVINTALKLEREKQGEDLSLDDQKAIIDLVSQNLGNLNFLEFGVQDNIYQLKLNHNSLEFKNLGKNQELENDYKNLGNQENVLAIKYDYGKTYDSALAEGTITSAITREDYIESEFAKYKSDLEVAYNSYNEYINVIQMAMINATDEYNKKHSQSMKKEYIDEAKTSTNDGIDQTEPTKTDESNSMNISLTPQIIMEDILSLEDESGKLILGASMEQMADYERQSFIHDALERSTNIQFEKPESLNDDQAYEAQKSCVYLNQIFRELSNNPEYLDALANKKDTREFLNKEYQKCDQCFIKNGGITAEQYEDAKDIKRAYTVLSDGTYASTEDGQKLINSSNLVKTAFDERMENNLKKSQETGLIMSDKNEKDFGSKNRLGEVKQENSSKDETNSFNNPTNSTSEATDKTEDEVTKIKYKDKYPKFDNEGLKKKLKPYCAKSIEKIVDGWIKMIENTMIISHKTPEMHFNASKNDDNHLINNENKNLDFHNNQDGEKANLSDAHKDNNDENAVGNNVNPEIKQEVLNNQESQTELEKMGDSGNTIKSPGHFEDIANDIKITVDDLSSLAFKLIGIQMGSWITNDEHKSSNGEKKYFNDAMKDYQKVFEFLGHEQTNPTIEDYRKNIKLQLETSILSDDSSSQNHKERIDSVAKIQNAITSENEELNNIKKSIDNVFSHDVNCHRTVGIPVFDMVTRPGIIGGGLTTYMIKSMEEKSDKEILNLLLKDPEFKNFQTGLKQSLIDLNNQLNYRDFEQKSSQKLQEADDGELNR